MSLSLLRLILAFCVSVASAAAWASPELEALHRSRVSYCQYFAWDKICGGVEVQPRSAVQRDAQFRVLNDLEELGEDFLSRPDYQEGLEELNSAYAEADEAGKMTIQLLALSLNQSWIARFQPEFELWLNMTENRSHQSMAIGWALYSGVFALTPELNSLPAVHRVLRQRFPWSVLALSVGVASASWAQQSNQSLRPKMITPPFQILNFGETDAPAKDLAAQVRHADDVKMREILSSNAALLALMAGGPAVSLQTASSAVRFARLSRFVAATRITPLTLAGSWLIGELVSLSYSEYRVRQMTQQFLTLNESDKYVGQELSLALNGLHLMYLAEGDRELRHVDEVVSLLLNTEKDLSDLRSEMILLGDRNAKFRTLREQPILTHASWYANDLRERYVTFIQQIESFKNYLASLKTDSKLKQDVLARRLVTLKDQQAVLRERLAGFPKEQIEQRLMSLFSKSTTGRGL